MSEPGVRVLVTGGRSYADREHVYRVLDAAHQRYVVDELIHGACPYGGADILAEDWAKDREIDYRGIPARFKRLGGKAGPLRNERMINALWPAPDIVIAFPGGRGTDDTVSRALAAHLHVIDERAYEPVGQGGDQP